MRPCCSKAKKNGHKRRSRFGSLPIQSGASIVYVKEQMGHHSIQVTVDTYGHLVPGANVGCMDRLDSAPLDIRKQDANASAPEEEGVPIELVDLISGPGGIRTPDQGIMSPLLYR